MGPWRAQKPEMEASGKKRKRKSKSCTRQIGFFFCCTPSVPPQLFTTQRRKMAVWELCVLVLIALTLFLGGLVATHTFEGGVAPSFCHTTHTPHPHNSPFFHANHCLDYHHKRYRRLKTMHIVAIVIAVTANFCRPALLAAFGAGSRSVSCQVISPSSDGFSVMVGGKEGGRDGEEAREGIIEGTRDGALEGVRVGLLVGLRLGAALTCAAAVGTRVGARLVVASIFAVAVGARVGAKETMLAPLPLAAASVGGAVMAGEQAGGGALAAMPKSCSVERHGHMSHLRRSRSKWVLSQSPRWHMTWRSGKFCTRYPIGTRKSPGSTTRPSQRPHPTSPTNSSERASSKWKRRSQSGVHISRRGRVQHHFFNRVDAVWALWQPIGIVGGHLAPLAPHHQQVQVVQNDFVRSCGDERVCPDQGNLERCQERAVATHRYSEDVGMHFFLRQGHGVADK